MIAKKDVYDFFRNNNIGDEDLLNQINDSLERNKKLPAFTYETLKKADMDKLCKWLTLNGFKDASDIFLKQKINGELFFKINVATIQGFGVAYGDAEKIIEKRDKLNSLPEERKNPEPSQASSDTDFTKVTDLDSIVKETIIIEGTVKELKKCVDDKDRDCNDLLEELFNLTKDNNEKNRVIAGKAGAIKAIVEVMKKHKYNPDACEKGCAALWSITANNGK